MDAEQLFIKCSRFGGTRLSYACAHYDRYRGCRSICKALKEKVLEIENFKELVQEHYAAKDKNQPALLSTNCCSRLPKKKAEFDCEKCGYSARSIRGLKTHMTRSHG